MAAETGPGPARTAEEIRQRTYPICQAIKTFDKVFGIGANKTGTTSLQAVFYVLGLKVAPQDEGELSTFAAHRGDLRRLQRYVEAYDAFQDAPFSNKSYYAQLDALFPGSKFILTIRDSETWFRSLCRFHAKRLGVADIKEITPERLRAFDYRFSGFLARNIEANWLMRVGENGRLIRDWSLLYDKDHYLRLYQSRNEEIQRHFSERPGDLLVIDLAQETDTAKIVEFLGLPRSFATMMPRLNVTNPGE